MKNNDTDITIVLDRSGSMESIRTDTIGGFNRFLADQQAIPGNCKITLNQFDDQFDTVIDAKPIAQAEPLTAKTFVPRGSTALLDAIGRSMAATGRRLAKDPVGKVVFLIITDGQENSSREFTHGQIKAQIEHQQKKYSWEFVYIGANQDAFAVGTAMGMNAGSVITYNCGTGSMRTVYATMSTNMADLRSLKKQDMSFTPEQQAAQAAANKEP